MCWLSSAPTSLPIEPSGPGPPIVAAARERSEVRRWASERSHSCVSRSRSAGVCRSGRDAHSETASAIVPAPRLLPLAPSAALVHQRGHCDPPPVADRAESVRIRNAGVGHVDLVELGLPRQLAQRPRLDARAVHVDDEVGQALVLRHVGVGAGEQQAPAGAVRQAGPHLLTVDNPFVAVGYRRGRQPGEVGTRARFGEQLAPDVLGGGQRPQEPALHVVGLGVFTHGRRRHPVSHRIEAERHRTARALQDRVGDGLQPPGYPEAAETLGKVHPRQTGVVAGAEEFGDGDGLRVVVGHDLSREIGDAIRIGYGAHAVTIGTAQPGRVSGDHSAAIDRAARYCRWSCH